MSVFWVIVFFGAVVLIGNWATRERSMLSADDRESATAEEVEVEKRFRRVDWADERFGGVFSVTAGDRVTTPVLQRVYLVPTGLRADFRFDEPLSARQFSDDHMLILGALLPGTHDVRVVHGETTRRKLVVELASRDPFEARAVEW